MIPRGEELVRNAGDGVTARIQPYTTEADEHLGTTSVRIVAEKCITAQSVCDVLVAALEGGSNYWIGGIKREAPISSSLDKDDFLRNGGVFLITEDGASRDRASEGDVALYGGSGKVNPMRLDLQALAYGCVKAAIHRGVTLDKFLDNHDALDADLALQFALFDEIVYG